MKKVFINPGHAPDGSPDPGAVNDRTGLRECDVTLAIGNKVSRYLEAAGCTTRVVQSSSLSEICRAANQWTADICISIHCNSAAIPEAKGTETWCCYGSEDSKKLADCIDRQIVSTIREINRGIKFQKPQVNGIYVLVNTDMTTVLIETAFISNQEDEKILSDPAGRDRFARAITRGILDYFGEKG